MQSNEYWQERFEYLQNQLLNKGDNYYNDLARAYERALISIEKDIIYFYHQFAKDNKITYAQATLMLNSRQRKRFEMDLEDYIEKGRTLNYSKKWDNRLKNASTTHRLSRLESLQIQIAQQIEELYTSFNTSMPVVARDILTEGQLRGIYELQKGTGKGTVFNKLDTKTIENIVVKPWANDKKTFSERIWKHKDDLIDRLEAKLEDAFIRGEPPGNLIKEIKEEFKVSKFEASRLVHTESAYFSSVSNLKSYEAMGVEKYIIMATLDHKTSEKCQDKDGKVFNIKDYVIGDTAPPFHPFCRTTTAPHGDFDIGGERSARGKDGKVYYVPSNITYKEWKAKYENKENK